MHGMHAHSGTPPSRLMLATRFWGCIVSEFGKICARLVAKFSCMVLWQHVSGLLVRKLCAAEHCVRALLRSLARLLRKAIKAPVCVRVPMLELSVIGRKPARADARACRQPRGVAARRLARQLSRPRPAPRHFQRSHLRSRRAPGRLLRPARLFGHRPALAPVSMPSRRGGTHGRRICGDLPGVLAGGGMGLLTVAVHPRALAILPLTMIADSTPVQLG